MQHKLNKDLLFILMSINLLKTDPEFLTCASLIVPSSGDILAKSLAMLGGADPMQEIIGL